MAVTYLGDNGPDGICMGTGTTEKIGFFGTTPTTRITVAALASAATIATAVLQIQLLQAELEAKGLIV